MPTDFQLDPLHLLVPTLKNDRTKLGIISNYKKGRIPCRLFSPDSMVKIVVQSPNLVGTDHGFRHPFTLEGQRVDHHSRSKFVTLHFDAIRASGKVLRNIL